MKRRVLISSAEAVPAKVQHTKACSDCPWSRAALNGWLGDNTAEEWIRFAHGESTIDCHTMTGVQCAGAAIYRANNGKLPRDPKQLRLPADRKAVFATAKEFLDHHAKVPMPKKPAKNPTQAQFEEVQEAINAVESDTKGVTRAQYRAFLEEVKGEVEMRLEVLDSETVPQKIGDCPDCFGQETSEGCLTCDGTGTICETCGEAPDACKCPKEKRR